MAIDEIIYGRGHRNIRSTHGTTFEITKETALTKQGNCIIAVGATKSVADLSESFKQAVKRGDARITIIIEADGSKEVINARGSKRMSFTHPFDIVVRTSDYVCDRTLAICADKAAKDFSRNLIRKLQDSHQDILITITVQTINRLQHLPQPAT